MSIDRLFLPSFLLYSLYSRSFHLYSNDRSITLFYILLSHFDIITQANEKKKNNKNHRVRFRHYNAYLYFRITT